VEFVVESVRGSWTKFLTGQRLTSIFDNVLAAGRYWKCVDLSLAYMFISESTVCNFCKKKILYVEVGLFVLHERAFRSGHTSRPTPCAFPISLETEKISRVSSSVLLKAFLKSESILPVFLAFYHAIERLTTVNCTCIAILRVTRSLGVNC